MTYFIDIQDVSDDGAPVKAEVLEYWASLTLKNVLPEAELTLRLVEPEEMQQLNAQYRGKNVKTNVLAFPAVHPEMIELNAPLLGDVIVCPSVLKEESITQGRDLIAHWAHIVIHGILHLLGYDHQKEQEAEVMQAKEIALLTELGFNNPYLISDLTPLDGLKKE